MKSSSWCGSRNPSLRQSRLSLTKHFSGSSPEPFHTASDLDPCVVTISSLTKTFGLGQLRCGWVVADKNRYPQFAEDWIRFESIGSKILEALSLLAFEQIDTLLSESTASISSATGNWSSPEPSDFATSGLIEGEIPALGLHLFSPLDKRARPGSARTALARRIRDSRLTGTASSATVAITIFASVSVDRPIPCEKGCRA